MKFVKSTAEILAYKVLNRDIDKTWVDWATEMLMNNYDTEHLIILAGIVPPYNQFYLQELTTKVLDELQLNYTNRDLTLKNYAYYLIGKALNEEYTYQSVLGILKSLYYELNNDTCFQDFMLLYWAKDDLLYSENQWYWDGADRSNIDKIIKDYFVKWFTSV